MNDNKQSQESRVKSQADENQQSAEPTIEETTPATEPETAVAEEQTQAETENSDISVDQIADESEKSDNQEEESESSDKNEATEETPAEEEVAEKPTNDNPNAKWYVVHTYSGHENRVATTLRQRIESEHLEEKILDILVPTQDKIEIKSGKKVSIKEKIFPGYILVKMVLDDASWLAVRTTQGVTSFVGIGNKPTPISESEVQTIVRFTKEEAPTYKQVFQVNDTVKIVDGPFAEFIGKIDHVDEERGKVKVLVSIFGRETPVELDFLQVQKI